jgi:branched-chain amino acid transport system substrate-binding protein
VADLDVGDRRWLSRRRVLRAGGAVLGISIVAPVLAACTSSRRAARTSGPGTASAPAKPAEKPEASAPGVAVDTVTLGSIYPLTGPAARYAVIVQTIDAYFRKVNDDGGVNGRTINFVVVDDQFAPSKTPPMAKQLVEQERVFALVGDMGTMTTAAIADYTTEQKVPLLYVASASNQWADYKKYPYIMGLPASYSQEARIFGRYITRTWPGKKVGIVYQADDFGKAYLAYKETVGPSNPAVGEESYEPGAVDLRQQLNNVRGKGTEVLILAATPRAAGIALKSAADMGWKPSVLLSSFAADPSLFGLAGGAPNVEGMISDIWVRSYDDGSPEVQAVKDLLAKYAPPVQFSQLSITGYAIAALMVETLKRAGINPTRQSLMAAAESCQNFELAQLAPGVTVSTSKTDHEPIKSVQLTRATAGRFVAFGEAVS